MSRGQMYFIPTLWATLELTTIMESTIDRSATSDSVDETREATKRRRTQEENVKLADRCRSSRHGGCMTCKHAENVERLVFSVSIKLTNHQSHKRKMTQVNICVVNKSKHKISILFQQNVFIWF